MPSQRLSLHHLVRPPTQPPAGRPPLLLLLHGVGSHEGDLMQLAPSLDGRFFVISARAPIPLGPGMYAWFHVVLDPFQPVINPQEAEQSRQTLLTFVDEVVNAYGADPRAVYLLGFSQGAIIGLSVALTSPEKIAGIVAMSGRILPEILPMMAAGEALRDLPIFVAHGVEDPILPIHHGRATRDCLAALPVRLTYREYPMGHHVTEDSLRDATAWLTERLDSSRQPGDP